MKTGKVRNRRSFVFTGVLFLLFAAFTALLRVVDVEPVGPNGSAVGFGAINKWVHELSGTYMPLYTLTDWLGLVPIFICVGFAVLGAVQLIKRKSLLRVDSDILVLGGFYLLTIAAYAFFEIFVINYRPVLINGNLEASYPSSTTMLTLCVTVTTIMQFHERVKNKAVRLALNLLLGVFAAFMVIGRLISGVHWFTDILGGVLLSAALIMLYALVANGVVKKFE